MKNAQLGVILAGCLLLCGPLRLMAAARPGWLGFDFEYHTSAAPAQDGWMFVRRVAPEGPAVRAGLRPQDLILRIDGKQLQFKTDLRLLEYLSHVMPGQRITVAVVRGKDRLTIPIIAANMTDEQFVRWQRNFDLARRRMLPPVQP